MTSVISTKRSASASDKRNGIIGQQHGSNPIQVRQKKQNQNNQKQSDSANSTNKPSGSGNLRIKVRLSDNRTDIMELAKGYWLFIYAI